MIAQSTLLMEPSVKFSYMPLYTLLTRQYLGVESTESLGQTHFAEQMPYLVESTKQWHMERLKNHVRI